MTALYLGTSGWSYPDWVGNFYPGEIKPIHYLPYYASKFPSVELDSTFYSSPDSDVVVKWREKVPSHFLFSPKFPKQITHEKKLMDCQQEVRDFIESISLLEDRLGPLLIQLPYGMKWSDFRTFEMFLPTLPEGYQYAIEVRHRSWLTQKFFDFMRARDLALVLYDHPWLPRITNITGNFVYIRWLGDKNLIRKNYDVPKIDRTRKMYWWAEVIRSAMQKNFPVFGYFNNNFCGHAPSSVWLLEDILANRPPRPGVLPPISKAKNARRKQKPVEKLPSFAGTEKQIFFDKESPILDIGNENDAVS